MVGVVGERERVDEDLVVGGTVVAGVVEEGVVDSEIVEFGSRNGIVSIFVVAVVTL